MTEFATRQDLARVAAVIEETPMAEAPAVVRQEIDRSFELPTGLYVATVALYLGFIGIMGTAFMNPGLVLPMAIFALFIVAGFGTPALWARMRPDHGSRAMRWLAFRNKGIQTATGHLDGGAAAVQVLVLPVLIFAWGVSVVVIAALT